MHLVILQEGDSTFESRVLGRHEHALQHAFARFVGRMSLAGEDDLHGTARVGQETPQAVRIAEQQIGALVRGKAAREAERKDVRGEERTGPCQFRRIFPLIAPTVSCLLTDVVKQEMAEAFVLPVPRSCAGRRSRPPGVFTPWPASGARRRCSPST